MASYHVSEKIIIDHAEELLEGINSLSTVRIEDLNTVISFIKEEASTMFYLNDKLVCRMVEEPDSVYLWLDTGLVNIYDNPIFISLLKQEDGSYAGHYFGTADILSNGIKNFFKWNRSEINKNLPKFKNKYNLRIEKRTRKHIEDENQFIMEHIRNEEKPVTLGNLLSTLHMDYTDAAAETAVKRNINSMAKEIPVLESTEMKKISGTKIILDLEFTRVDKENADMKKLSKFETIQIGAVKLDSDNEIIGRYESFVKPRYSQNIEESVVAITHNTDSLIEDAPDYIDIINGFLDWAGNTRTVISWSTTDLIQLKAESIQKNFEDRRLHEMFENWVDLLDW